jgi:hypothetical protein
MNIDDLVSELLEQEMVEDDGSVEFSSKARELIHKIAKLCNKIPIVKETQAQAEEYAKDLTAEQVYYDMLCKIIDAPTRIHMRLSARMLISIIDRKFR